VVDVQDAAMLGFIGLCDRTGRNSQSDSCNELRYHENPPQIAPLRFLATSAIDGLTVTLTGVFFSIN
jgi:hypothetical protein